MRRKDIRIGDTVVVRKAGDVIPEVVSAITSKRRGSERAFRMPEKCPACGAAAVRAGGEAVTRCTGIDCPAQRFERILHWGSRGAMDIEGLGPAVINELLGEGLIDDPADLYTLSRDDLMSVSHFQEKAAENLFRSFADSRGRPFSKVLFGLGIKHVGAHVALMLAGTFPTFDDLIAADYHDLIQLPEIGPRIAESVLSFFREERNLKMIEKLKEAGLNPVEGGAGTEGQLTGRTFVLTGTLEAFPREEARRRIEEQGGRVSSSVSGNTDYVVAGASPGSKLAKAQAAGVPVLDEAQFLELIGE